MAKDARVESRETVSRVPVSGNRDVLTVDGKEDGFVYRWVLDQRNRVQKFKRGGYEVVTDEVVVGDVRAGVPTPTGSPVTADSGGETLYLMRIRKEYYDEDQAAKEREVSAVEQAMGLDVDGRYGKINIERK